MGSAAPWCVYPGGAHGFGVGGGLWETCSDYRIPCPRRDFARFLCLLVCFIAGRCGRRFSLRFVPRCHGTVFSFCGLDGSRCADLCGQLLSIAVKCCRWRLYPIQSNNNMNRNPESESGIRIPNQNLKEERFSLFSIQSNPMQCNPTAAARMIFGAAAWTREREFTDFSEKADRENGGRSCAPFFYLEDSGSGAEKNCRMPSVCRGRDPAFCHGEAATEKNIGKDTKSGRNRAKTMICC